MAGSKSEDIDFGIYFEDEESSMMKKKIKKPKKTPLFWIIKNLILDVCDVTLSVYPHQASLKNIFQAHLVWIYTQNNITNIIFT